MVGCLLDNRGALEGHTPGPHTRTRRECPRNVAQVYLLNQVLATVLIISMRYTIPCPESTLKLSRLHCGMSLDANICVRGAQHSALC